MIPSTRICIAPACTAQTRLIQSIKELDFHKGHSSSSLGQITKKLKDLFPSFPIPQSLNSLLNAKLQALNDLLQSHQARFQSLIDSLVLADSVAKFLNSEYTLINDHAIDVVVKNLANNLPDLIEVQLPDYQRLQLDITSQFDALHSLLAAQPSKVSALPDLPDLPDLPEIPDPASKTLFVPMPEAYAKYTTFQIDGLSAKHLDGYPSFVMTNRLAVPGTAFKLLITNIQEKYVGVAVGLMEKAAMEKHGLILTGEQLQKPGHGTYLNFNDACVYHSDIENGAVEGKDKGVAFRSGDTIELSLAKGHFRIRNCNSGSEFLMPVPDHEMLWVAWLDLSELRVL